MSTLRNTLDFLLYDWLDVGALAERERFCDHSRETFDAVLDTCERIAREKYAPFNLKTAVPPEQTPANPALARVCADLAHSPNG